MGMVCSVTPVLIEDLCVVQKEEIFNNMLCVKGTLDERPGIFIRDKPTFSSERMLHKDYDRKGSVAKKKNSGRESQRAWRQDELIGGGPPVVK
jgi:hypothetical protein